MLLDKNSINNDNTTRLFRNLDIIESIIGDYMDWKKFLKVYFSKGSFIARLVVFLCFFLGVILISKLFCVVSYYGSTCNINLKIIYLYFLGTFSFYFQIELFVLMITLFQFNKFKQKYYVAVFYLTTFVCLNIFWDFDNGKYDQYYFVGLYFFFVFLIGFFLSAFNKKKDLEK